MAIAPAKTGIVTATLVGEQVYEYLEAEILSGRLPSGTRLGIRQLAETVGTSVMPVRDAISRLEESGLATKTPHKGAIVRAFSASELIDTYAVRALLESQAAHDGAAAISDEDLLLMQDSFAAIDLALSAGQISDAIAADSQMLRILYNACGNAVLTDMIESLWKHCHYYRVMAATDAYERSDLSIWEPSREILRAAIDHASGAAATEVRESLEAVVAALRTHTNN